MSRPQPNSTEVRDFLAHCQVDRPKPDRNLDQFYATPETVLHRADKLAGLPTLASIVFLGDDDLTSLALAVRRPGLAITVIDIDRRILAHIERLSRESKLAITCVEHDLRRPLPKSVGTEHQAAFFDPPYTPVAVRTWLQRALETTLGRGSNRDRKQPARLANRSYYCCYGYTAAATERGLAIQQLMTEAGFVIQAKVRDFNEYQGAASIGSHSDLYELAATPRIDLRAVDTTRSTFYTGHRTKR